MGNDRKTTQVNHMNEQFSAESAQAGHTDSEQYLTFFMGDEEFGVNILSVQEIRGWDPVTPIPNAPRHVVGVMNLRGTVVPIVDLRRCFAMPKVQYTEQTVVIILSVQAGPQHKKIIGVVVDAVSDVYNFDLNSIQPSPELSQSEQAQYVKGLGSTDSRMVILLELTGNLLADTATPSAPVSSFRRAG